MSNRASINFSNTVNVYARIAAELDERLRIATARKRISKPKALESAIEGWVRSVEAGATITNPGESTIPDPGDAIGMQPDAASTTPRNKVDSLPGRHEINSSTTGPLSHLTDLEQILLEAVLRIYRCKKPGLPDALVSNVIQFEEFRSLYERFGNTDPLRKAAPGQEERAGGAYGGIAELKRATKRIGDELRKIEEHGIPGDGGKAGDSGKTRKRRGA